MRGTAGKNAIIFVDRVLPLKNVELYPIEENFPSPQDLTDASQRVLAQVKDQENFFDAPRWSPCAVIFEDGRLNILVRQSSYLALRAIRGRSAEEIKELFPQEGSANFANLPNLLTVYGTTETADGYLVFAQRDPLKSDQDDVTAKPAGFISLERRETVTECLVREFNEELAVVRSECPLTPASGCIDMGRALHLGNTFALDRVWDVTNHAYLPIAALSNELAIPLRRKGEVWSAEHKLMIFVPNSEQAISQIFRDGHVTVGESAFQFSALALASLLRYLNARRSGIIAPARVREDDIIIASDKSIKA